MMTAIVADVERAVAGVHLGGTGLLKGEDAQGHPADPQDHLDTTVNGAGAGAEMESETGNETETVIGIDAIGTTNTGVNTASLSRFIELTVGFILHVRIHEAMY